MVNIQLILLTKQQKSSEIEVYLCGLRNQINVCRNETENDCTFNTDPNGCMLNQSIKC